MLHDTNTTIALSCPHCGGLSWHLLSLFSFDNQKRPFICDCGHLVLTIEKKKKYYCIITGCGYCEMTHIHSFTRQELMSKKIKELLCTEVDGAFGLIGPQRKLKQHLEKHHNPFTSLALEFDSVDYFENYAVMLSILEKIHDLIETDEFRCICGNKQLEIDILPNQLELHCSECNHEYYVPASEASDLDFFDLNGFLTKEELGENEISLKLKIRLRTKAID